jgi:phage shock protein PspC (stress-responsive transcriptional regulator)
MTVSSEHHGYGIDRVAERLAIVAIVISGVAATVIWLYLLW